MAGSLACKLLTYWRNSKILTANFIVFGVFAKLVTTVHQGDEVRCVRCQALSVVLKLGTAVLRCEWEEIKIVKVSVVGDGVASSSTKIGIF